MPQRKSKPQGHKRSEGVQIRLDPALKQQARVSLTRAQMTWQDLLEPCIRHFVAAAHGPTAQPPQAHALPAPQGRGPYPPQPLDLTQMLRDATSVELWLGSATYRRWIHRCTRCQQCWVAEKARPDKCIHGNNTFAKMGVRQGG